MDDSFDYDPLNWHEVASATEAAQRNDTPAPCGDGWEPEPDTELLHDQAKQAKLQALPLKLENIPLMLRELRRWVVWQHVADVDQKTGKVEYDKPPVNARTSKLASSTNPKTWSTFDDAVAALQDMDGIGFVLHREGADEGLVGIDLDHCRDPQTGQIDQWARNIVGKINSYTEVSPSGAGLRIFLIGNLPPTGRKKGNYENYQTGRYVTVTGHRVEGTPETIERRQEQIDAVHREVFGEPAKPANNGHAIPDACLPVDDMDIVSRATKAKSGAKFRRLWNGDRAGYSSASEADLALASYLAFWTGPDPERIERLFAQSGLFRSKWQREDYRRRTIEKALAGKSEFYDWHRTNDNGKRPPRGEVSANNKGALERIELDAAREDLATITPDAIEALRASNEPPRLFRYGAPARIERDDNGAPFVRELTRERMRHELARSIRWFRNKKVGDTVQQVDALPPKAVVEDVLATPELPLPILLRVVEAPIFAADGTLHSSPGYHPATRAFYIPGPGFNVPEIPEAPSAQQIRDAVSFIGEPIAQFPFIDDAERTHALAAMILPFVRDLIDGPTPLHLFEAPAPGTGKTLLVHATAYPILGRTIAALTEGRDEDEWRKRVFGKLRGGPCAVLLDNLRRRLDSAALASVLTAFPHWEDRILGTSEVQRVPVRCAWLATGNNPALSNEMTRRTIRIRLDAKLDRPWLRTGFKLNLNEWLKEHRSELVAAILTLVRGWFQAGRPDGEKTIGMFESWAKVIGGILAVAGVPGFLANLTEFYDEADTDGTTLRSFIAEWWSAHEQSHVTVAELFPLAGTAAIDLSGGGRGKDSEQAQKIRLGKLLHENRDRVFAVEVSGETRSLCVQRCGEIRRAALWRLKEQQSV
jgi:hypothetical protein